MLAATNRSPMRPAHIHFKVEKDGFDPLITHVFAEGDEFLDSDAVFGVRGSCIGNYVRHDSGPTPFGDVLEQPFYTLDYRFTLQPRSEEHTSELQSLMRISYAVFCLKKKQQLNI